MEFKRKNNLCDALNHFCTFENQPQIIKRKNSYEKSNPYITITALAADFSLQYAGAGTPQA
ncbi:MAG TPA: hypothetical protein PLT81_04455, partial [Bacteroidales bacterium]|nr:hypothetical protein [Bacteroidales bacterium]HPK39500.1 hypothetical protein [Bacteroidales bacterium]